MIRLELEPEEAEWLQKTLNLVMQLSRHYDPLFGSARDISGRLQNKLSRAVLHYEPMQHSENMSKLVVLRAGKVLKANQVTLQQAQAIHDYLLLTHPHQAVDELELENEIVKKLAEGSIR